MVTVHWEIPEDLALLLAETLECAEAPERRVRCDPDNPINKVYFDLNCLGENLSQSLRS